ncbi:hypothetical protein AM501_20575 [Aneurinibacillus migulanus]|uniref:DNA modification system-associated small protein n=1 Tax=Aneurinibacillus migulanus TaxID=47500 RepID=UPI0005BAEEB8|nr:DNA modification system-associated small protein [Aneurinibacillus migulanus]KIV56070.1 hypothetical protein TS64_11365 [Aneurinibacillus migulanus]KPD06594.1 hypothetical protein AM501_20575 [Aneurinibacillus migulanus]
MRQGLTPEEEAILQKICNKHHINTEHLRILLSIEKEYANKNTARGTACQKELLKHIELWAR